jgi:membrane-bound lytic murein transglycosylase C
VKYSQGYRTRAVVDFDQGRLFVETLDLADPVGTLTRTVTTALLTPDDPSAVEMFSTRPVRLGGQPYLQGVVSDQTGRPIAGAAHAEAYARHLVTRQRHSRVVQTPDGPRLLYYVSLPLMADHGGRLARRYAPLVERHARRFGVSRSLVYAVMRVESGFNPFAVSRAGALGLMQLVPESGGRDAYRYARGRERVPDRHYLLDPGNNIELGVAYLSLLERQLQAGVRNPVAREYCIIAAYNGGVDSLLAGFARDPEQALARINRMSPSQVYEHLRRHHPYGETRRYVSRVVEARGRFAGL